AIRAYMESYSPYDNVPVGDRPDLLVTGSLHDPRVLVHEPAKWVARLRATAASGGRVLFRPELGAGAHVGPAGRYDKLAYAAAIACTPRIVASSHGLSAVGHVDSFTTTVCDGTCTNMCCPLMPAA